MTLAQRTWPRLRVVRHDAGVDCWEMVHAQPHPRLRPYVIRYCGYDEQTTSFTRRIEAAGVEVPLIINLGPPLGVQLSTEQQFTDHHDGFVAGLHDGYAVVDSHGSQRGLEISLTPVGAQRLLGLSMREIPAGSYPSSRRSERSRPRFAAKSSRPSIGPARLPSPKGF